MVVDAGSGVIPGGYRVHIEDLEDFEPETES